MSGHNVVTACLPAGVYGITAATSVTKDMLSTYQSIKVELIVGLGGGAPSEVNEIHLGDIVVSQPSDSPGLKAAVCSMIVGRCETNDEWRNGLTAISWAPDGRSFIGSPFDQWV